MLEVLVEHPTTGFDGLQFLENAVSPIVDRAGTSLSPRSSVHRFSATSRTNDERLDVLRFFFDESLPACFLSLGYYEVYMFVFGIGTRHFEPLETLGVLEQRLVNS